MRDSKTRGCAMRPALPNLEIRPRKPQDERSRSDCSGRLDSFGCDARRVSRDFFATALLVAALSTATTARTTLATFSARTASMPSGTSPSGFKLFEADAAVV